MPADNRIQDDNTHTTDPWYLLKCALDALTASKPNDRSELDRRYAVTITDTEKVVAYFKTYVVDYEPPQLDNGEKDLQI